MVLGGVVVTRVRPAVRRLDAAVIAQKTPGDKVAESPCPSSVVEARLDGTVAAAIQRDRTAGSLKPVLRRDIDDAGGAQPVLCRQCAGEHAQRGNEARIQGLAKDADALRQDDAVQSILQTVVLTADMELTE